MIWLILNLQLFNISTHGSWKQSAQTANMMFSFIIIEMIIFKYCKKMNARNAFSLALGKKMQN